MLGPGFQAQQKHSVPILLTAASCICAVVTIAYNTEGGWREGRASAPGQRPCAPGPRPCTPGLKDERRHLARSPTASSTRSVTRMQTGQPQGRTTATWPKAARDHDARGASLLAILSQSSSDNPSAKIMESLSLTSTTLDNVSAPITRHLSAIPALIKP